ncbi:TPA: 2-succinyl-6-hydroxy-2,4-cyclohexadiene-1-carboxylate synthase [Pasteurella multocida]|nr:2-succinyl-6-hydroxy-2,4-cyclohexadiene-1-carboxylate synthase [Pasteurella multocida]HDR1548821.1 2-succinyl-6-hydroxy-2,4-cyclohexadiene-1-carboxylate synthase [Pasteurella multocida]HDR1884788.1 2-succinyl-6-hydroxy-2,4-cyclohexadiene-1-carboxylate synthase [Pasteurella multocida]HED4408046.1 2-succinyl-6-hydroxy-2,4-cyclohexadiene-1-carboxylate synthase [Pasteurella multocida]
MPVFVFLHGLLGSKHDWQKVIENLPHFSCLALDLPFHDDAKTVCVADFEQTCAYVEQQLQQLGNQPYYLVGYSLGGRIALYYAFAYLSKTKAKHHLHGLILEGANLGLQHDEERKIRWQQDLAWATRFRTEPMASVLDDWYQQPVFSHLTPQARQDLIQKRAIHCGEHIANMLLATSLAKQPDFRPYLIASTFPIYYFCGEKDHKFKQMAEQTKLPLVIIPEAGHNAHVEQPIVFANNIKTHFPFDV